jgi:hypothetical protein
MRKKFPKLVKKLLSAPADFMVSGTLEIAKINGKKKKKK